MTTITLPSVFLNLEKTRREQNLPDAHATTFDTLVALLDAIHRSKTAETPNHFWLRSIGQSLFELGTDTESGKKYMLGAYIALQNEYGWEFDILKHEWDGIGYWKP